MTSLKPSDLPAYWEFILPTVAAVAALGKSATVNEISDRVLADLHPSEDMLAVTYANNSNKPVYTDRMAWGRSYAKSIGALESPKRGVFLLTQLGADLLALSETEAIARVVELDREFRRRRLEEREAASPPDATDGAPAAPSDDAEEPTWQDHLLARLHRLSPEGFEEFVLYLLRLYGLDLQRVGGTGDEGIDGIGTAPLSPVISSRVAVQVKRYDPNGRGVGRETVALFQRDALTAGAERAILVTLSYFTPAARKAATITSPTVDLIDGERLAMLALEQEAGVRPTPVVDGSWFDRFNG